MTKTLAAVAGALCLGFFASTAQAAPFGAAGSAPAAAPSGIIQVHGLHSSCKLDRFGWHRSFVWGRAGCGPKWKQHHHHHHHHKKHWKKHWKKHH